MRTKIFIQSICAVLLLALYSCKDDTASFSPGIGAEAFSFRPIAGGAVMHYSLPDDEDVVGVNIRYKDYAGKECIVSGSALCDSLTLVGFNEAQTNINGQVRLVKRNGEESSPVNVTFSTADSGPITFFKDVKVASGWNGFSVTTDNPEGSSGMAHVFYLGTNPYTNQPDTILLESFAIKPGKDTLTFEPKSGKDVNTIVIRTEDYRGYMVKQEVYPDIASYNTVILPPSEFTFSWNSCIEDSAYFLGAKYLFDGDTKGSTWFDNRDSNEYYFALAGPAAVGDPMYIDMGHDRLTAQVRMYAALQAENREPDGRYVVGHHTPYSPIFDYNYISKLPCDVVVYGAKDDGGTAGDWDSKSWVRLGSYSQNRTIERSSRWCKNCFWDWYDTNSKQTLPTYSSKAEMDAADPLYLAVTFPADGQGDGYRYLKIIVNRTFFTRERSSGTNVSNYVTMQELEVYTKK